MSVTRLKTLLALQNELILEFAEMEQELQSAIVGQDWQSLEQRLRALDGLSRRIAAVDAERDSAITDVKAELGLPVDAGFGEVAGRYDDAERKVLLTLYRALQITVVRAKGVTEQLDAYVRGSVSTTNALLHELFPDQKGTLYSRLGHRSPADSRALVVDRHL